MNKEEEITELLKKINQKDLENVSEPRRRLVLFLKDFFHVK